MDISLRGSELILSPNSNWEQDQNFLPSSARSEITWTVTLGYFGNISTKHNKTWENNQEESATHFGVHSRSVTWGMRTQDPSSAMPLTISRKLLRWSSTWCMCIAHHSASLRSIPICQAGQLLRFLEFPSQLVAILFGRFAFHCVLQCFATAATGRFRSHLFCE